MKNYVVNIDHYCKTYKIKKRNALRIVLEKIGFLKPKKLKHFMFSIETDDCILITMSPNTANKFGFKHKQILILETANGTTI